MAYIRKRKKSYSVVYRVNDADGMEHQKSEGYTTLKEAEKRKREIEYKQSLGTFVVPKCTKVKELILGNPEMAALLKSLAKSMKM